MYYSFVLADCNVLLLCPRGLYCITLFVLADCITLCPCGQFCITLCPRGLLCITLVLVEL